MQRQFSDLLSAKRFLPLFLTQFFEAFNDNFFKTALLILITYKLAHSVKMAEILVTVAGGIFILPFFLFSATAGQIADKYNKAIVIRLIKVVEISAMLLAAIGFSLNNIPLLLVTLFFMGIHSAFFGPLKYAILPDHLAKDELIAGNALIEASTFIAILIGTIFGGILMSVSYGISIVATLGIIIAVTGLVCSFFIPNTMRAQADLNISLNFITETKKIIDYAKDNHRIFLCILGISWFWAVGFTLLTQFPNFTKNVINGTSGVVTLFLGTFSIGVAIGSLLAERVQNKQLTSKYVPLGVIGMTIFIMDLYFASHSLSSPSDSSSLTLWHFLASFNHWRMLLDTLLLSACGGLYIVPLYAIMQAEAPESNRARIIAVNNIMNAFFMVIATIITSLLFAIHFTIPQIFLLLSILNALVALYICKLLPDAMIKSFFAWVLKAIYRVKIVGLENFNAATTPAIIVANHSSFIDALLLSAFLPEKMLFAINSHVAKKWWIKPFLSLANTFPLDPTKPMATKSLIHVLKDQPQYCIIFPEGRLTTTGGLMKIYEGPGLIADKTNSDILPIRIDGVQYTPFTYLKGKMRYRWFPQITITILPPRKFHINESVTSSRARRRLISAQLYDLMCSLIFESSDYHKTIYEALLEAKKIYGAKHKILEDIERKPINYRQFIMRSYILGRYIAHHSTPKENIGVLLPNATATAICFFAIHAFGRIPAMLNFSTGVKNIILACTAAEIKTIYTSRKFIDTAKLSHVIEKINQETTVHIIYLEDLRSQLSIWHKIAGVIFVLFPNYFYSTINPEIKSTDHAVILFTSGSEGTPKGVVHSHETILANVYQMSSRIDFTANDIAFNPLPVFHSFGLTTGLILPIINGVKTFLYPSPLHYRIIPELVYDTNATIFYGTDTFLTGYARAAHPYDFYSIRYVFAGAEKLKDETRNAWSEKFGISIFEGYGVTETAPVISVNTAMENKNGTVGRFLPKIAYKIQPVPGILEGGRLFVSGPNIMLGYLFAEQPGKINAPDGGWHDTGDIVSIDERGYITIKGRAKRFAKIGGEMISLTAVEDYITKCWPDVLHAAVSIPDPKKGETVVLVTEKKNAKREELIEYYQKQGIGEIYLPKKILIVEAMPVLGTGKIDYVSVNNYVSAELKQP